MKKTKIIAIILILFFGIIVCGETFAVDQKMLGAELNRPFNDNNGDGTVGNDRYVLEDDHNIFTATKIYDKDDITEYLSSIYCLRGGKGFGVGTSELNNSNYEPVQYNKIGSLKENAKAVIEEYEKLYGVNLNREEEITFDGITKKVNLYNALLWITDNAYLPKDIKNLDGKVVYTASEYREQLLNKAGITSKQSQEKITDDDIEVVQQFAMWYFVNYDEQAKENFATVSQKDKNIMGKVKIGNGIKFEDYEMSKNTNELNILYQFFIKSAIGNAEKYGKEDIRQNEIDLNNLPKLEDTKPQNITVKSTKGKEYSVFGPFEITGEITELTKIGMYFKNGDNEEEIEKNPLIVIVNNPEDMAPKASILEEVIGQGQFYIKMPKIDNLSMLKIVLTNSYYETISTAWEADKNAKENQAVVIIEREKITIEDTIETEDPKEFDLSLRKFITSVERDGEKVEIANREPQIYIQDLKNGTATTARYVHPKNLLTLKKGDIITYTLRIYNEGELDGYATLVKDYLPEGLELVEGENVIWTVDGNVLSTDLSKNHILYAYNPNATGKDIIKTYWQKAEDDESGLYYLDFKVVCRIKDNVENGQILKNVAEIYNHKAEVEIDRDSVPGNVYEDEKHEPGNEVNGYTPGEQDDDDFERVTIEANEIFDLALRKYIVAINGVELTGDRSRVPQVDTKPLQQLETTANYNHKKEPVSVKAGDEITYRFATYNEGNVAGYVYSIIDYLPEYLEFIPTEEFITSEKYNSLLKLSYEELQKEDLSKVKYVYEFDVENKKITVSDFLEPKLTGGAYLWGLKAYDGGDSLDSKYLDLKFKVKDNVVSEKDMILTNAATMEYGSYIPTTTPNDYFDRDSKGETFTVPTQEQLVSENKVAYKGDSTNKDDLDDSKYYYKGQQDDDDFEKIIIKGIPFDLSLRKFITSVERNGKQVEFEDRTPKIDTTTLVNGTFNRNGQNEYTATYEHSKEPLIVKQGDIVTYTLRIYNEGERAGYATEITDYIPEGLALIVQHKENQENKWKLPADIDTSKVISLVGQNSFYKTESEVKNIELEDLLGVTSLKEVQLVTGKVNITSDVLKDELLKPFDAKLTKDKAGSNWQAASKGEGGLYYRDVELTCLVIEENTSKDILTNIAEISRDKDENKQDVTDRDSTPNNVHSKNEDDDDYEPIMLKYFDLALRKFITGVEDKGTTTEVTSRIPKLTMGQDGKIKYEHSKEPVEVVTGNTVIYTLRVYNEGTIAGYAEEIKDNIPEGLKYLPEHKINKEYEWVMVDKEGNITKNANEAVEIKTGYLSKAKEVKQEFKMTDETTGQTIEIAVRENIINPFDSSKQISDDNPSFKDVKVAFEVTEPSTSDRIIINSAQISEDSDNDEDSIPDKWNDGEDDQDKEYIYVKYFDLSLLKWVTKSIVTVDGKTTTTQTGFKPNQGKTETTGIRNNQEAEPIAKVEVDKRKINKTTVKFTYKIRVTNEGEIAGYATEITDYIPEGLEFYPEDETNKKYGWVKTSDSKITTRVLETVLLEPNESVELEITFRWKNNANNIGIKTNVAEISEDYNDSGIKDIDSTTDNITKPYEKEQEDDDDFALVILTIATGKGTSYFAIITTVLAILATGIYLIKKYVLIY